MEDDEGECLKSNMKTYFFVPFRVKELPDQKLNNLHFLSLSRSVKFFKMKINWINHLIEFIVVIIGILVAFELDSISTENAEKRILEMHLIQINEETDFNKSNVKSAIDYGEINLKNSDSLLSLLTQNKRS